MRFLIKSLIVLLFSNLNAVVIVVHGTFATTEKWCRPNGQFYTEMEKQAKKLDQKVIPFTWSGGLSDKDRIQGAEALAQIILSYPAEEKKILIGHSHGGNVINFASQLLNHSLHATMTNEECNHSTPKDARKWYWFIQRFWSYIFGSRKKSMEDPWEVEEALMKAVKSVGEAHKEFYRTAKIKKDYLVDRIYLLGTPIDLEFYPPDMSIIKNAYSFYSKGDSIQPVFGLFRRLIANIPRAVNFRITIEDSGVFDDDPSHSEIHDPMVATWLLDIPITLQTKRVYGFENFLPTRNGKIHFDSEGQPHFKLDKRSAEEREKKESDRAETMRRMFTPDLGLRKMKGKGLLKKAKILGKAINKLTLDAALRFPILTL